MHETIGALPLLLRDLKFIARVAYFEFAVAWIEVAFLFF
jgi:hypothetical protein